MNRDEIRAQVNQINHSTYDAVQQLNENDVAGRMVLTLGAILRTLQVEIEVMLDLREELVHHKENEIWKPKVIKYGADS